MKKLILGIALAVLLPSAVNAKDVCLKRVILVNPPSDMTARPEYTSYFKLKIVPVPKNGAANLVGVSRFGSFWGENAVGFIRGVAIGMTDGTITYQLEALEVNPSFSAHFDIYVTNADKKTFVGEAYNDASNPTSVLSFVDCNEYPMPITTPVIP